MSYQKKSTQIFIAGGKGQGKTTLIDAIASTRPRVFCFDPNGEYLSKGYHQSSTIADAARYAANNWARGFRIAFVPSFENMQTQLDQFSHLICKLQQPYKDTVDGKMPPIPKVLLIIDEMQWVYPQHANCPWFQMIMGRGRHYGIDVIGAAVRLAEVATRFRGVCDLHFFFAQHDHTDIATASKMVGRANVGFLKSLRPHEFLRVYQGQVTRGKNNLR